jgi:hypothetical protein
MKTIALTLIAAGLGFAQSQSVTPPSKPATNAKKLKTTPPPAAAPKPQPPVAQKATAAQKANPPITAIPAGATEVEPNVYRVTDSSGKTWMYRQTPFGISRYEDTPASAPQTPAASEPVAVTDLGDSVRFEKKTAFGPSQWVRKKTELTDDEKALVASQGAAGGQGVAAGQSNKPVTATAPSEKKTPEKQ